jgi:hypothetical protein
MAFGAGGRLLRLLWGRIVLYSRRQFSMVILASFSAKNNSRSRSLSQNMDQFSGGRSRAWRTGMPCWMYISARQKSASSPLMFRSTSNCVTCGVPGFLGQVFTEPEPARFHAVALPPSPLLSASARTPDHGKYPASKPQMRIGSK